MQILMITDNDPAGMGIAFTNAINRHTEHRSRLITTAERYGHNYEVDIHLPDILDDDYDEVEQLLKDADIIHFHLLRDENTHLGPLVIRDYVKGRRIVHHHHGHPDFLINAEAYNEKYKRLMRKVIVSTPDLLKVAENSIWIPNLVPLNNVAFLPRYDCYLPQDIIKICQAPTRKFHKHTEEFKATVTQLKMIFSNIQEVIIERTAYDECLKEKRGCHIIFDHMRGWFGIASLESLAHGKPVIAGLDDWNVECIRRFTGAETVPWVIARDTVQLKEKLEELIKDSDLRYEIGKKSRLFMEEYWNEKQVVDLLMNVYMSL